jgi:hypothetical protein
MDFVIASPERQKTTRTIDMNNSKQPDKASRNMNEVLDIKLRFGNMRSNIQLPFQHTRK